MFSFTLDLVLLLAELSAAPSSTRAGIDWLRQRSEYFQSQIRDSESESESIQEGVLMVDLDDIPDNHTTPLAYECVRAYARDMLPEEEVEYLFDEDTDFSPVECWLIQGQRLGKRLVYPYHIITPVVISCLLYSFGTDGGRSSCPQELAYFMILPFSMSYIHWALDLGNHRQRPLPEAAIVGRDFPPDPALLTTVFGHH